MKSLDKKIKIKLQTLVEGKINEDVAGTLEQLIAKYGQKFVNLFGDDVIRAAEVNLGDDAVGLLAKSINNATLLTTTAQGEKAFITLGNNDVKIQWIIDDLEKINRNPRMRQYVMDAYSDLQLKNGTYVRDFFKKTKPKPIPKINTLKQKWDKVKDNEFVRGFNTKNAIIKWAKNIPKWSPKIQRLTPAERGQIVVWFNSGIPNVREIARIYRKTGWNKDLVMKSLLNVSGQIVGRWWWWTWRLAALEFFKGVVDDIPSDNFKYKELGIALWTRFTEAWSWSGLHYLIPAKVAYDNLFPIFDGLVRGSIQNALVNKGELVIKLGETIDAFKKALQKIENYSKSAESKKLIRDKLSDTRNKVDSTVNAVDTTGILNFNPNQSSSDSTTRQRTDNAVKPKFVNPF
jgi:hypothetical protein